MLLGWLAVCHRRWGWAGFLFGLSITAHFTAIFFITISIAAIGILHLRPAQWKMWLRLGLGLIIPILCTEGIFFLYLGVPFIWLKGILEVLRGFSQFHPEAKCAWLWVFESVVGSNGPWLGAVSAFSFAAPFILFKKDRGAFALSFASVGAVGLYTVQAGLGRSILYPIVLASLYPFWAICTGIAFSEAVKLLPTPKAQHIGLAVVALMLVTAVAHTNVFMYRFLQTLYPSVEQWIAHAAAEKRPVRFVGGSAYMALYFARIHGTEMLVIDGRWIGERKPGQAVLIFGTSPSPAFLPCDGYTFTTIEGDASLDTVYPLLAQPDGSEAFIPRYFELWWPAHAAEPLDKTPPLPAAYYSGTGCVTRPAYGYGTMHFYQLALNRLSARLFRNTP